MKKIDRETVQRILDAADIVEVVSDFVSLKKRGVNYVGLCPFHNERTPSFSVSRAKGICKCFSCGKGGSPVNFIMEHEQMTYNEALRYLAKKYNIEIREHEMTDAEKQESTERESMMAINDFALSHFEHNLMTPDGKEIGLAYFRERGINDQMIEKFHLGYALEKSDDLLKAALHKGFSEKYLIQTGLCSRSEKDGRIYDRFRGRVIYPVFSVSGRVVAFGGRTLRSDKSMAKYVNSPESIIYRKSYEVYGMYQAKSAIMKHDKCILVEGYMDVISMHQIGIENVVASSGTSLTEGQIRLIHRFTQNVTVIYDSDAAGIKASLRGIDLLLSEGIAVKVLLLPDGEDPDSFAQSHSSTEVLDYISNNETDFIRFKTRILLKDAGDDPIMRSRVISDIVNSISLIPNPVTRAIYLQECSRMLDIEEKVLSLHLDKSLADNAIKLQKSEVQRQQAKTETNNDNISNLNGTPTKTQESNRRVDNAAKNDLRNPELVLAKYIVRYGLLVIPENNMTVVDFINEELSNDDIEFSDPVCKKIFDEALQIETTTWVNELAERTSKIDSRMRAEIAEGEDLIRQNAKDLADIQKKEKDLLELCEAKRNEELHKFSTNYLEGVFLSSPDDEIRIMSTKLAEDKYQLSKVHTKYSHVDTEEERLYELVWRGIMELKFEILNAQIIELNDDIKKISSTTPNAPELTDMLKEIYELYQIKSQFSKLLGDRIVHPK